MREKRAFSSDDDVSEDGADVSSRGSKRSKTSGGDAGGGNQKKSFLAQSLWEAGLILSSGSEDSSRHVLTVHQEDFRKKLTRFFKLAIDVSETVNRFNNELKAWLDVSDEVLSGALQPTKSESTKEDGRAGISSNTPFQDSVIRLLLGVDLVQHELATYLLEKTALLAIEEEDATREEENDAICAPSQGIMNAPTQHERPSASVPKEILNHFRWLNRLVRESAFVEKILEILDAVPEGIKQEIVICLPEIVSDTYHATVAKNLIERLNEGHMTNVILDTLTNLSLGPEVVGDIQAQVMRTLSSVSLKDLPVMVKFILQGVQHGTELEVISKLRTVINLSPLPVFSVSSQAALTAMTQRKSLASKKTQPQSVRRYSNEEESDSSDVAVVVDVVRMSLTSNRRVGDAWVRAMEAVKSWKEHRPIDLFVCMILADLPKRRKAVETLFKNKVRQGVFNEDYFHKTLRSHKTSLKPYFRTLVSITESFMHSSEPVLQRFSGVIYREMFLAFDRFCQQEIIADLVTKISSNGSHAGSAGVTATATLESLAVSHTEKVAPFAIFTASLLDYLDTLELSQVRQVMDIMSLLAYACPSQASVLRDDIHIVLRKQMSFGGTSKGKCLRQMGIIGSVVTVKNMAHYASVNNSRVETSMSSQDTTTGSSTVPISVLKQAREILDRVKESVKVQAEVYGLFMDELANVVECAKMHRKLERWIAETMADDFQDDFIVDFTPGELAGTDTGPGRETDLVEQRLRYSLDTGGGEDEPDIAVNLGPLVAGKKISAGGGSSSYTSRRPPLGNKAARMIPHFGLLRICTAAQKEGSLEDVDALLGCPMWMPSKDVVDNFGCLETRAEKDAVCATLFYAINWMRELINGFAASPETEYRPKVLLRLKNLLEIRDDLNQCLKNNLSFIPPPVLHLVDTSGWQSPAAQAAKAKASANSKSSTKSKTDKKGLVKGNWRIKKGDKRKGKRKGAEECETSPVKSPPNQTTMHQPNTQASPLKTTPEKPVASGSDINWSHYSPFFRELDMAAFKILSYDTVKIGSKGTWADELGDPKLRPPELRFLLTDLSSKLQHVLGNTVKKGPFGAGPETASLKSAGFNKIDRMGAEQVAKEAVDLLEYILADFEEVCEYFKRLLDLNEGEREGLDKFFAENVGDTAALIDATEKSLVILHSIFSWSGFRNSGSAGLLRRSLVVVGRRLKPDLSESKGGLDDAVVAAVAHLERFGDVVINVATADALVKLMEVITGFHSTPEDSEVTKPVSGLAGKFLKTSWINALTGEKEKGSKFNGHVESLLKIYLQTSTADNPLKAVEAYVESKALEEVLSKDSGYTSKVYPTFCKATLSCHFRMLLGHLVTAVRDNLTFGTTKDHEAQYDIWSDAVDHLYSLVQVLKVAQGSSARPLILSVIKSGRQFLDHFLKHGMPMLDVLFRRRSEDCVTLLKNLQQSTRYLQHVCNHSKTSKDVSLTNHVPLLKRSLETFLFRVKLMLAHNNVAEVFWMGNLKNRDLKGEEIPDTETEEDEEEDDTGEQEDEDGENKSPEKSDQSEVELSEDETSSERMRPPPSKRKPLTLAQEAESLEV